MVDANPYTQLYGYDANGNRFSISYPSGRTVTYAFDFADRPSAANSGLTTTYVSSAAYAPFGPETSLAFGNGTTQTKAYDTRYRPTENKLVKDTPLTTLAQYTYMEDGVGNITQINDAVDVTFNRGFSYDDLNRVKTANTRATPLWGNGTYNYDAMGNITSLAFGTVRTASFAYVGTTPKLSQVAETGFGTRNVTYDPTGNETAVGSGTFAYSSRNYLSSGDGLTYTYDGRGLRTIVVNSDVTPAKRYFFYSPEMNPLSESELTTLPAPLIQNDYVWFNGHPVGQINGGTQWTFTDHLGTPLIQTNTTGDVFWRAEHEPYGKVFSLRTTNQHQPLRLPGQESEELNLSANGNGASERFYNIFRWYRYGWGRYTQADPLGLKLGPRAFLSEDPGVRAVLNLYSYASGDPVDLTDPSGLLTCRCQRRLKPLRKRAGPFYHEYLRIGSSFDCKANPSYGFFPTEDPFFSRGRVLVGDLDTMDEVCTPLACNDDKRALDRIGQLAANPGFYCLIGTNCQNWVDDVVFHSHVDGCCVPRIPTQPPNQCSSGPNCLNIR